MKIKKKKPKPVVPVIVRKYLNGVLISEEHMSLEKLAETATYRTQELAPIDGSYNAMEIEYPTHPDPKERFLRYGKHPDWPEDTIFKGDSKSTTYDPEIQDVDQAWEDFRRFGEERYGKVVADHADVLKPIFYAAFVAGVRYIHAKISEVGKVSSAKLDVLLKPRSEDMISKRTQ